MAVQATWQRLIVVVGALLTLAWCGAAASAAAPETGAQSEARRILARLPGDRGICVVLAPEPAELAVAMARASQWTIYVQVPAEQATRAAQAQVEQAGLLGTRVYVEQGGWSRIHLADNLADAVIVAAEAIEAAKGHRKELLRVVNPLGKVLLGAEQITKPYPAEADNWSHPYYAPDNNPQSYDRLARAPYLTQFLAEPWYVPQPEVTVASAGRVFKAFGHIAFKQREWPWLNTLIAINGYNGTLLWKRALEPAFMIHRNTMIATPETLYLADDKSCKLLDPATGAVKDEIIAPQGSEGPVWKWMALEGGILYALVGQRETPDPVRRGTSASPGWPWKPLTPNYDSPEYSWGFGRTMFAINPKTKQVLWIHQEEDPIDSRAVCMRNGRIYCYSHPKWLACLDAKQGKALWRSTDPQLLAAIGPHDQAQIYTKGFSSSSYVKCSQEAIYFAGPQRQRLVAVAADDGRLLWQYPQGNYQLVLRDEGLYAMGRLHPSKLFEPLSGRVLAELEPLRGNCTRATGAIDCILCRGDNHGGTLRLTVPDNHPQRIGLMRPDCHDGVIIAGGLLYWGPWMCDCNLSLVGLICLGPAQGFVLQTAATEAQRVRPALGVDEPVRPLPVAPGDWPTYRADNRRSTSSPVGIPAKVSVAWQFSPPASVDPAAPITAGGLVFTGASDGVIRVLDAADGTLRWKGYTGGPILYPPALDQGRLFVGSADGWVYAFEAASGRPLWQFRAAPAERKINLYGCLASTWPVASGVLVQDGVVYAAAGIASYDGTHVYALDAQTGRIRWQNNTSGRLAGEGAGSGVSVQGHLLLHEGRLYLAGGNVVSPAIYDPKDGRCLNTLDNIWGKGPRGRELFVVGGNVVAFDRLLYAPKQYQACRYFPGHLLQADCSDVIIRGARGKVVRIAPGTAADKKQPKAVWESNHFEHAAAMGLGNNAVVVAGQLPSAAADAPPRYALAALAVADGRLLWEEPLPAMPAVGGLALDAAGRIVVALEGGRTVCFAAAK